MKFSEQWLRQWVQPDVTSEQLQEQLSMAGLEVDGCTPVAVQVENVMAVRLIEFQVHPEKANLHLCQIDTGECRVQVVSAADNLYADGMYVYAQPGARLGDKSIAAKTIAGVNSEGVLCSAEDLGMEERSSGLLQLDPGIKPGEAIDRVLGLDDVIIELDLTPNRGDCFSIRGLAREVGVLNGVAVHPPAMAPVAAQTDSRFPIRIDAPQDCPRYVGRVVEGVNNRVQTPSWMLERLRRSGVRGLSFLVDVTNYVMLELGQPLHVFDLPKLQGSIVVRHSYKGESITLLNGETRQLHPGTLLISDETRPLALAGIMGGADSAVDEASETVFLESAYFTPSLLAGKPRFYNLYTDSSHRFERGVDSGLQVQAIERATELILQIAGGRPGPVLEEQSQQHLPPVAEITLRYDRLRQVLGEAPGIPEVQAILQRLGMSVTYDEVARHWQVVAPSYRPDIQIEVDLIEEIARINGYHRIPDTPAHASLQVTPILETRQSEQRVVDVLLARGYSEAITYSFIDADSQALLDPDGQAIALSNPLSEEQAVMRTSLWPGLLKSCRHNLHRQQERVRLFEIGLIYQGTPADIHQYKRVGALACGPHLPQQWGVQADSAGFFSVKSDFLALLGLTGRAEEFIFKKERHRALHPGQSAIIEFESRPVGWIGSIAPQVAAVWGMDSSVYVFEIDYAVFQQCRIPQYQEITKFPPVRRDLAFVVDASLPAQHVAGSIREAAGENLHALELFDVYTGDRVAPGKKSLAYALRLQHKHRTLTEKEAEQIIANVIAYLKKHHQATLRD